MKVVVMVSHGEYAAGLHDALKMFVGNRDDVVSIGLKQGEDVASLEVRIDAVCDSFNEADEFIILADLIGGSPLTTLMKCFAKRDYLKHSVILGGMNLAMALNAVLMKENDLAQVKEIALNEAGADVMENGIAVRKTEEYNQILQIADAGIQELLKNEVDIENGLIKIQRQIYSYLQK